MLDFVSLEGLLLLLRQVERACRAASSVLRARTKLEDWRRLLQNLRLNFDDFLASNASRLNDDLLRVGDSVSVAPLSITLEEMERIYNQVNREGTSKRQLNKSLKSHEKDFNRLKDEFDQQLSALKQAIRERFPPLVSQGYLEK